MSLLPYLINRASDKVDWGDKDSAIDVNYEIVDESIPAIRKQTDIATEQSPTEQSPIEQSPTELVTLPKFDKDKAKSILNTMGKGANFLLPHLVKSAAKAIDVGMSIPKVVLDGSMSDKQRAIYGRGLGGGVADVMAKSSQVFSSPLNEIADALLLHRMQQKYIDMLKKQEEHLNRSQLSGHALDYLGRQASGLAFMNNQRGTQNVNKR